MFPSQLKLSVAIQETYQIYIFHIVYRKKNRAEDGVIDSITILAPLSNGFGYDCAAAAALTARLLQHCVIKNISHHYRLTYWVDYCERRREETRERGRRKGGGKW